MQAVFLLFLLAWLGWRRRLAVIEAWLFVQNWALRAALAGAIPLAVLAQSIPSPHKVRVVEAAVMLVLTTWLTADAGAVERRFGRMARLIRRIGDAPALVGGTWHTGPGHGRVTPEDPSHWYSISVQRIHALVFSKMVV